VITVKSPGVARIVESWGLRWGGYGQRKRANVCDILGENLLKGVHVEDKETANE
jgi:hypothetical protein